MNTNIWHLKSYLYLQHPTSIHTLSSLHSRRCACYRQAPQCGCMNTLYSSQPKATGLYQTLSTQGESASKLKQSPFVYINQYTCSEINTSLFVINENLNETAVENELRYTKMGDTTAAVPYRECLSICFVSVRDL